MQKRVLGTGGPGISAPGFGCVGPGESLAGIQVQGERYPASIAGCVGR